MCGNNVDLVRFSPSENRIALKFVKYTHHLNKSKYRFHHDQYTTLLHVHMYNQRLYTCTNVQSASIYMYKCTISVYIHVQMYNQRLYTCTNVQSASLYMYKCSSKLLLACFDASLPVAM